MWTLWLKRSNRHCYLDLLSQLDVLSTYPIFCSPSKYKSNKLCCRYFLQRLESYFFVIPCDAIRQNFCYHWLLIMILNIQAPTDPDTHTHIMCDIYKLIFNVLYRHSFPMKCSPGSIIHLFLFVLIFFFFSLFTSFCLSIRTLSNKSIHADVDIRCAMKKICQRIWHYSV